MPRTLPFDIVRWPTTTDPEGYHPDPAWQKELLDNGIICSNCGAIRSNRIRQLDRVVVKNSKAVSGLLTGIWGFSGAKLIGRRVVDCIGRDRLEQIGRLVPVMSPAGHTLDAHLALIGKTSPGAIRTENPDRPSLCSDCGRLGYWPNWPPSKWYLLRRYWKTGADLMLINGWMLCSDTIWKKILEPEHFRRMVGHKVALVEEPTDGFPADYRKMVAEIRRRGWMT